MQTAKILSVNISKEKGTVKEAVEKIILNDRGVEGDAHAGKWHRQVSLLGKESVDKFSVEAGRPIKFGEFAENITTEGIILYETHPLDKFVIGDIELEVTQIGKKCHGDSCAIYREVGNCVMPKEGIFTRVLKGGELKAGMHMEYYPKVFKILIITLSDRAFSGEYSDRSGPRLKTLCLEHFDSMGWKCEIENIVIPDNSDELDAILKDTKEKNIDFVFTTGGTGIGPRDITPEVVSDNLDKEIPGIMEMIRVKYGAEKPNALLSRGVAGTMGTSLVFALPGSVKAVNEYMEEIKRHIRHLVMMMHGIDSHG